MYDLKVFVRLASSIQHDQIQYLNIDQKITALCSHQQHHTVVAMGTTSHLLIYDIADNKIITSREVLFYKVFKKLFLNDFVWHKKIENGVGAVLIGCFGDSDETTVVVGGNCFVQFFNMEGSERYWNVMSDQVTALALVDFDGDGHNQVTFH